MMKKIIVALGFTMAAMSAQATLVFTNLGTTIAINDPLGNQITGDLVGTTYNYGTLTADLGDIVTFQNISGKAEAGYENFFINDTALFKNKSDVGTFSYEVTTAGLLGFTFKDQGGIIFGNGSKSIAVLGDGFGGFKLLLNDSGDGDDFDDHAVSVSAVPLPAALPLMASALGMFGLSRRKSKKAA